MFLNKLLLKEFGKFNNQEVTLGKGFNLVYGAKESGKTTLKDFIVSMIYGISNSKKDLELSDNRRPIDGFGFTGKAYVKHGDNSYLVERDFSKTNKKTSVMDIMSGREVSLKQKNSIQGTIINLDKGIYLDTLCIEGCKKKSSKEISDDLNDYMHKLTTCGTSDYNLQRALKELTEKRDSFSTYEYDRKIDKLTDDLQDYEDVEDCLRVVNERIEKLDEEFALETAKRKREARVLISSEKGEEFVDSEDINEQLDELTSNSVFLNPADMSNRNAEKKFTDKMWVILLTGLFVIGVVCAMVNILPLTKAIREIFCICAVVIVAITIVEGVVAKGLLKDENPLPSEDEFKRIIYEMERKQEAQDVEIDMSYAKEFMDRKAELREIEGEFLERQNKKSEIESEKAELIKKRDEILREIHCLNLAINTLNSISKEINEELGDVLNVGVNDIISKITSGKYTDIRFDDRHKLYVKTEDGYNEFANVRVEDMRQLYVAIRIAIAKKICKDSMPIILDELFYGCDKFTIANALECLAEIDSDQIVILTANESFKNLMDGSGVEYTYNAI